MKVTIETRPLPTLTYGPGRVARVLCLDGEPAFRLTAWGRGPAEARAARLLRAAGDLLDAARAGRALLAGLLDAGLLDAGLPEDARVTARALLGRFDDALSRAEGR